MIVKFHWLTTAFFLLVTGVFGQGNLVKKGDRYYDDNEFMIARTLYAKAYRESPERSIAEKLVDCAIKTGDEAYALSMIDSLNPSDSSNFPLPLAYAQLLRHQEKYEEAIAWYQRIDTADTIAAAMQKEAIEFCRLLQDPNKPMPQCTGRQIITYCLDLDATATIDTARPDLIYEWEFDDGAHQSGTKVSHCYDTEGEHKVWLHIFDPQTLSRDKKEVETIVDFPPPFSITAWGVVSIGSEMNFDASSNVPEDVDYVFWDFGDHQSAVGMQASHTFSYPGNYKVKAYVIGAGEVLACASTNINITRSLHDK